MSLAPGALADRAQGRVGHCGARLGVRPDRRGEEAQGSLQARVPARPEWARGRRRPQRRAAAAAQGAGAAHRHGAAAGPPRDGQGGNGAQAWWRFKPCFGCAVMVPLPLYPWYF